MTGVRRRPTENVIHKHVYTEKDVGRLKEFPSSVPKRDIGVSQLVSHGRSVYTTD